jgi:hypothetical protein
MGDSDHRRTTGLLLILTGVWINVPFAILMFTFDYPEILRRSAADILEEVYKAGTGLVLTWYAFSLAPVLFMAAALMLHRKLAESSKAPWLTVASVFGVLGGLLQALGLLRWVFVIPHLARTYAEPAAGGAERRAAKVLFESLHQYFGVALGEYLSSLLLGLWLVLVSVALLRIARAPRWLAWLGIASGVAMLLGLNEGFSTVTEWKPGLLALLTPLSFVGLSIWLVLVGGWLLVGETRD